MSFIKAIVSYWLLTKCSVVDGNEYEYIMERLFIKNWNKIEKLKHDQTNRCRLDLARKFNLARVPRVTLT